MKKNLTIIGLCLMWLAGLSLSAYAVQTIDTPHVNLDSNGATEDCSTCHFSTDLATGAAIVPGSTCVGCHTSDLGGYTDTTAPLAATHQSFPCETCHNPHVSQQYGIAAPLVSGTLSLVTPGTTQTTMTVSGVVGITPWPATPSMWTAKSINGMDTSQIAIRKADRGLILWVTVGADNYSFEVKDTALYPSITVKGVMPAIADGTAFELHYGELLANKVTPGVSYRYGTSPVTHTDASGNPEFVDASTNNGICQTCHTVTKHYTNAATETTHHVGETCTKCHLHSNGFTPDTTQCANCHTTYPEPPLTGMHTIHASTTGYNFPCEVCHKGGMTSWKPGPNDKLQLGFNLVPLGTTNFSGANTSYDGMASGTLTPINQYGAPGYQGENDTTVTTGGSLTCSNIYCHSNGYSAGINDDTSGASIPSRWTSSTLDTTPKWDGSSVDADGNLCNNCHDNGNFPATTFTTTNYTSPASHALPGYNVHWPHALFGVGCMYCHNNTVNTADSSLITNKSSHANGVVNVKSGGSYGAGAVDYTYDPTTHSCSGTIQCHAAGRIWKNLNRNDYGAGDDVTYPVVAASPNVDPVIMSFSAYSTDANTLILTEESYDPDYKNPLKSAAFGGGFNGSAGLFQFRFADEATRWEGRNMTDQPTDYLITHRYTDAYLAGRTGADKGTVAVDWYATDNSPNAVYNAQHGLSGGWSYSGWKSIDMAAVAINDPMANKLPIASYTASNNTGTWILHLTITARDPDYLDSTKYAYYGNKGHNGGDGMIQIDWQDGPKQLLPLVMTDIDTQTVFTHDYSTDTTVTSTGDTWFTYYVADNHYLNVSATYDQLVGSGWKHYIFQ